MKKAIFLSTLIITFGIAIAAGAEVISWVRVHTPGSADYDELVSDPQLDVVTEWRGEYADIVAAEADIARLRDNGYVIEYRMYDIYDPAHYAGKGYSNYTNYDEMKTRLDALAAGYPDIVSLTDLGPGRQDTHNVWLLKISDDVASDDPNEPDAMLTGVHHAREPMSLEVPLYFAEQLCDKYGSDPEVADIVNNMELYIIPCLNPEGYNYDDVESSRNWWRKNGYDWPDPMYPDQPDPGFPYGAYGTGVDLNRNYSFNWGNGSSPDHPTYCGLSAFSEPEADAIGDLSVAHTASGNSFVSAFHYHSYGQIFLRPYSWNHTDPPADDLAIFDEIYQGYRDVIYDESGITFDYSAGSSIGSAYDYMYAEHGTYAYTVELNQDFYPDDSQIAPTCSRHNEALKWWCGYIIDNFSSTGIDDGDDPTAPSSFKLLSVYPNPVSDKASFSFVLPESAEVHLGLFDISGRKVMTVSEDRPAGENIMTTGIDGLTSGLYLYKFETGEERTVGKIVVK